MRLHIARIGGEDDDAGFWKLAADRADRIQTAHLRHLQVHQCDIWPVRPELLHGLAPIRGFSHQRQIGLCGN